MKTATQLSPGVERLEERQIRNWELARAQRAHKKLAPKRVHDFVAISRQVGSGGHEVAQLLAERLGWPLFDKEILHAMAGNDAVRERLYQALDEREVGWLEQILDVIIDGRFSAANYFHRLSKGILLLAHGAPSIFLGRGADLILPADQGVRVRLVAPLRDRVRRFAKLTGVDENTARQKVLDLDHARHDFVRSHFRKDIDDPARWDLTINTSRLSPAQTVELILHLMREHGIATDHI